MRELLKQNGMGIDMNQSLKVTTGYISYNTLQVQKDGIV
jgi:hypothetical protein